MRENTIVDWGKQRLKYRGNDEGTENTWETQQRRIRHNKARGAKLNTLNKGCKTFIIKQETTERKTIKRAWHRQTGRSEGTWETEWERERRRERHDRLIRIRMMGGREHGMTHKEENMGVEEGNKAQGLGQKDPGPWHMGSRNQEVIDCKGFFLKSKY